MIDFTRLADVAAVDEIQDGDTVLVVRDGEVYRADKGNIGGAGGYVLEIGVEDIADYSPTDSGGEKSITITKPIDEMLEVIKKGGSVVFKIAGEVWLLFDDQSEYSEYFAGKSMYYVAGAIWTGDMLDSILGAGVEMEFNGLAVVYIPSILLDGFFITFTNGQEIPTEATAAALSLDGSSGGSGGMAALKARLGMKAVNGTTADASEATQEVKAVE